MTEYKKLTLQKIRSEILRRRYLRKDEDGEVTETEDQMYRRVATTIAEVEARYGASDSQIKAVADKFYELMVKSNFLPNSPTLMNAGSENGMLSACFVLPIEDSIEGIFEAVKQTALIQKAGGGTGFSFDRLRPTGYLVSSSGGTTSSPISFRRIIAKTTNAIQQGAFRRGANMGMMSIQHPDILKFINAKSEPGVFNNFNISIKVPDGFMKKLLASPGIQHVVVNPRTNKKYSIPCTLEISSYTINDLMPVEKADNGCYTVKEIWDMIIANAHSNGEPGVSYIDRVNEDNPTPTLGRIQATNPCGEQPLLAYESCNLGSVNISRFVLEDGTDLDWNRLAGTVKLTVRFLDDVTDDNCWPVPEIREISLGNRRIGLGIMGFADTLFLLGIRYDSEEAVEFAEKLACFIQSHARDASEELAKERGAFPNWTGSVWDTKYHRPMRNAACTTVAPTGSISIIAGCSNGIEPIFSIISKRKVLDGQEFIQLHPLVEDLSTKEGWLSAKVLESLSQGVPPRDISEIPKKLADVLLSAHEISPERYVRIQAAFQKYTDNAVSKTVNLPSDASVQDVDKIYRLAFELGCKGITVYRDRSRENQVIAAAHAVDPRVERMISPRPKPSKTMVETIKFRIGCGTLFVTVNKDDDGLCEVFANLGKAGGCAPQTEATCRAVSIGLRAGVRPGEFINQLKSIRCLSTIARRKTNKDISVVSCADAIAAAIEETLGKKCESENFILISKCSSRGYPLKRRGLQCVR